MGLGDVESAVDQGASGGSLGPQGPEVGTRARWGWVGHGVPIALEIGVAPVLSGSYIIFRFGIGCGLGKKGSAIKILESSCSSCFSIENKKFTTWRDFTITVTILFITKEIEVSFQGDRVCWYREPHLTFI